MTFQLAEQPILFPCESEELVGILHGANANSKTGVLIVVGGPQYRVGSHRQFVLLARELAKNGIPVLRFDYRGMGDSTGGLRNFEYVDLDIRSAIDTFFNQVPALRQVVIWGLCDAASAALFYAQSDRRVAGLVLLNPWVRTEAGQAKAYLKHYYLSRLFSKDFWRKLLSGQFKPSESLQSISDLSKTARASDENACGVAPLPQRMLEGLRQFNGKVQIILSGDDLTAAEFRDLIGQSKEWKRELKQKRVEFKDLPSANHTFSSAEWRRWVEQQTLDVVRRM